MLSRLEDNLSSASASSSSSSSSLSASTSTPTILPSTRTQYLTNAEKRILKQNQKTEGSQLTKARLAGEFTVPTGVPNGLVGTPLTTLHTNFHLLPSSLIQRLGIGSRFHQIQGRRFDYQEINYPYDDDEKLQRIQQQEIALEAEEPEEWDRQLAAYPVLDKGRGLGFVDDEEVFEHQVDNPWDKGDASGLVHYTDALLWSERRGGFDELTTDSWDVENPDTSSRERSIQKRKKFINSTQSRNNQQSITNSQKQSLSKKVQVASLLQQTTSPAPPPSDYARGLLASMGWTPGTGLGRTQQGRAEPIQPVVLLPRRGLGLHKPDPKVVFTTNASLPGGQELGVDDQDKLSVDISRETRRLHQRWNINPDPTLFLDSTMHPELSMSHHHISQDSFQKKKRTSSFFRENKSKYHKRYKGDNKDDNWMNEDERSSNERETPHLAEQTHINTIYDSVYQVKDDLATGLDKPLGSFPLPS